MGHVKSFQVSEGRGCMEWFTISLSEVATIKSLIKYRSEYDKFDQAKRYETNNPYVSNGVMQFYEIICIVYLDLDRLIKKTRLTAKQTFVITKLMQGYSERDLGEKYHWDVLSIKKILHNACCRIKRTNDLEWHTWLSASEKAKKNQ